MNNRVLVAIDETGLSYVTVDTLSAQMIPIQTDVLVLEVVEPLIYTAPPEMAPGFAPEMAARQEEILDRAKANLVRAEELIRKAGFNVETRVVESEIKLGILTVAAEWGADLIVVAPHERKGVAKFLHRSVAEAIVHQASCSVLVLKESARKIAAA